MVRRVLIVDDYEPFRAVARELLEAAGFLVSGEAADAAEALAAVVAEQPDAVLLDVQLPGRDGFSLATAITANGGPVVVLVSSREAEDYGRARRGLRRVGLHCEAEALRGGVCCPCQLMSSTAVMPSRTASVLSDPVLLAPAIVAAGLGVGWLGVDAGISGARVAADLALSWASSRLPSSPWSEGAGGDRAPCSPSPHSRCSPRTFNGRMRMPCGRWASCWTRPG